MGKSTLMDSLFNTNFESTPSPHTLPTVKLKAHTYELQEGNVRLKVFLIGIKYINFYMHVILANHLRYSWIWRSNKQGRQF